MSVSVHRREAYDGTIVVSVVGSALGDSGSVEVRMEFRETAGPQAALSALARLCLEVLVACRDVQGLHRAKTLMEVFAEEDARAAREAGPAGADRV